MSGVEVDPPAGEAIPGGSRTGQHFPHVRVWVLTLTAGLIAGFAAWLIGEATHGRFAPPTLVNMAGPSGGFLSGPEVQKLDTAKRSAQILDAALVFGSLGAVFGLALGLAGGFARRSARLASRAAIAGGILGGAVSAAVIAVILPIYYRILDPDNNELIVGFLFHAVISSAIGAVGGAAFGTGLGDRSRGPRRLRRSPRCCRRGDGLWDGRSRRVPARSDFQPDLRDVGYAPLCPGRGDDPRLRRSRLGRPGR